MTTSASCARDVSLEMGLTKDGEIVDVKVLHTPSRPPSGAEKGGGPTRRESKKKAPNGYDDGADCELSSVPQSICILLF